MNIPKKVNIAGHVFRVILCDRMLDVDTTNESGDILGQINPSTHVIRLYRDNPNILSTFLHEVIHGVLWAVSEENEEGRVNKIARCLSDTLIRNKLV